MLRTLALAALLSVAALPASAGFKEGVAAYNRGDYRSAYRDFKPLAEQGDAYAQNYLGVMYGKGQGISRNDRESFGWFRKAALRGYAKAQHNLGTMYGNGRGVPKNYGEAIKWYRKAALQGYTSAQFKLGTMYQNGRAVPKNYRL